MGWAFQFRAVPGRVLGLLVVTRAVARHDGERRSRNESNPFTPNAAWFQESFETRNCMYQDRKKNIWDVDQVSILKLSDF